MAVNRDPILKKCRSLGIDPLFLGINKKSNRQPGANVRKKVSEYGVQLKEKQKVKFYYNLLEKQFRRYYEEAEKMKGVTGHNMLSLIERRFDNIVFRMGLASSRRQARQMVNHAMFSINGKKVNIPSYRLKAGDVIEVRESKKELELFKQLKGMKIVMPKWLEFDSEKLVGKVVALPTREDVDLEIHEHLIIELYSR